MRPERTMSEDEKRWRRRDDARTLAQAESIKSDKERYREAILGAKEIAQEEIDRVKGIAKVAGMKTPSAPREPVSERGVNPTPERTGCRYHNPATIGRL